MTTFSKAVAEGLNGTFAQSLADKANPNVTPAKIVSADTLPVYRCHKLVKAAEIVNLIDHGATIDDPLGLVINVALKIPAGPNSKLTEIAIVRVDRSVFARSRPKPGDYLVVYDDGYISHSPRKAFEDGYHIPDAVDPVRERQAQNLADIARTITIPIEDVRGEMRADGDMVHVGAEKGPEPKGETERPITPGRIVQYRVTAEQARAINASRVHSDMADEAAYRTNVGNPVHPGDSYPMMVVRVFGGALVNGQVFLDGNDSLWATSVSEGGIQGTWRWPDRG